MQTPELLSDPVFHDEDAARAYIEEVRWPDHVFCPFCGAWKRSTSSAANRWGQAGGIAARARTSSPSVSA